MKLFNKISAIVMATAMFGMSAMAAGVITLDKEVTVASDATQVSFEIKVDEGTTIGEYAYFVLTFDNEVFTPNETLSSCGYGEIQEYNQTDGKITWTVSENTTVTADEDTLVSYVFDVNTGKDPDGKEFSILTSDDDWGMTVDEDWAEYIALPANTTIKVVVEESDPQPGDIKTEETVLSGSKKYLEIYDKNTQPRYVVIDTISSIQADDASVLKATYGDEEKTAKLFDLLTVDEGATGGITINNLTIKMVLPYGSEQPGADDFSFAVVKE